jgi:hypothetical protein
MKRRRRLPGTFVCCRGWNRRILARFYWKLGIVLIVCILAIGCGKDSSTESETEPPSKVVTESAAEEKPITELEGEPEEKKIEEEPSTRKEKVFEPSSTEPEVTEKQVSTTIAGVAITEKLVELLDYELSGRSWGWRPNDLLIGRFTDNVNEFQLGALEAIRYTAVKLKESLTRFGDADAYDPHLIEAVNLLMNRSDQFWFPSTESQYKEALEELQAFLSNLRQGKSRFYYRTDNLLALIASYKDLLGNCHENLVKEEETDGSRVSHFRADNYFYYSQGVAHVMYEILRTVRVGFVGQLQTIDAVALMDKIVEDLERASECDPWLITNSDYDGILANHRYNLAAPISSALHNMSTMLRY